MNKVDIRTKSEEDLNAKRKNELDFKMKRMLLHRHCYLKYNNKLVKGNNRKQKKKLVTLLNKQGWLMKNSNVSVNKNNAIVMKQLNRLRSRDTKKKKFNVSNLSDSKRGSNVVIVAQAHLVTLLTTKKRDRRSMSRDNKHFKLRKKLLR